MDYDIFNNSALVFERKVPPKIIGYQIVLVIAILLFLLISVFIKLPNKTTSIAKVIIEKGDVYVLTNLEKAIITDYTFQALDINNKPYDFKVVDMVDNQSNYTITLKLKEKNSLRNDEVVLINLKLSETTLFNKLINLIKKGLI